MVTWLEKWMIYYLEKIEELTLYTIEQQKLIEDLQKQINQLKKDE
ncbi:MAG: hypothetical protein Kow0068_01600 [Marinilabiliales bacterium]